MPPNPCEPCSCKPEDLARSADTYKAAHLRILCQILGAFDAVIDPDNPISFTVIPGPGWDALTTGLATEATLASIKDTDGIKKITDDVTVIPGTGWVDGVATGYTANLYRGLLAKAVKGGLVEDINLGQQVEADSVPVVLPAAQIATLTPPAAITGFATSALQTTLNSYVDSLETYLLAIKDTDGIKKIVDTVTVTGPLTAAELGAAGLATQATLASALTALQLIDNCISGSGVNISQINGVTPLMGSGATGTGSLRVTMATNSADVTALQIMDDWDESDRAKVNLIAGQAGITAGAGAVAANTPRVTHASDDPAVVALQLIDNFISGSRGLVTEDNSAAIKTAVEVLDNFISGSRGLVTEDNSASIKTAVELIDNIVPSINGPGAPTIDSYTTVAINLAAGNNQVLVSSAANKQIWVYGIGFTVNVAGTVSFQDEDDTAITGIMQIAALGGMTVAPSGNFAMPLWKLATDKDLEVDVVTSELDGWLTYALVSV